MALPGVVVKRDCRFDLFLYFVRLQRSELLHVQQHLVCTSMRPLVLRRHHLGLVRYAPSMRMETTGAFRLLSNLPNPVGMRPCLPLLRHLPGRVQQNHAMVANDLHHAANGLHIRQELLLGDTAHQPQQRCEQAIAKVIVRRHDLYAVRVHREGGDHEVQRRGVVAHDDKRRLQRGRQGLPDPQSVAQFEKRLQRASGQCIQHPIGRMYAALV